MKKKKDPQDGVAKIKLTNGMIYAIQNHPSFGKIVSSACWRSDTKFLIKRWLRKLNDSPEVKAYNDTRNELVRAHDEAQKEKNELDRTALTLDHPDIQKLHEMDSGLEIEKLILKSKILPDDLSPAEQMSIDWLIEIEEDN